MLLLVSALSLSACDTNSGAVASNGTKTAVIGVMAPLTGEVAAFGLGIQHSVELAVNQANASNAIPGWRLKVESRDDKGDPGVGKKVATAFAGEADVAGVVGNLNSMVSQSSQPVLAAANIVQVSPSNTNPTLTRGAKYATDPVRRYATYFRTCTTDAYQGPFAARYLIEKAGINKVATLHDKTTYGQGVVETFTAEFTRLGGTVVTTGTINPEKPNYTPFISKLSQLAALMTGASLKVKLMGADGVYDPKYIALAGASASGDLATNVGAPTSHLATGQKFLSDYEKAGYKEPSAAYGGYSFDAANAIINALKVSLKDAKDVASTRKATIDALDKTSFDGVTGKVDFDQYGDSVTHMLTIYQVTDAKWVPISTEFVM
jgi:branched-chain amino acid transport system substrate-binding protein